MINSRSPLNLYAFKLSLCKFKSFIKLNLHRQKGNLDAKGISSRD